MALQSSASLVAHSLVVCSVFVYVIVGLRLLARFKQKRPLMASDWMMLAALASFTSYAGVMFALAYNPTGSLDLSVDLSALPPRLVVPFVKESFATEILLGLTITLSKLSLLLFWRSIFPTRNFQKLNNYVIGCTILWFIGTSLTLFLQCNPRAAAWNAVLLVNAKCVSLEHVVAGYEASNILIDILIVFLPVNEVRKLQTSGSRKVGIIFLVIMGGFVIVTSAIRIRYTNVSRHIYGRHVRLLDATKTTLWTIIQQTFTILGANLPSLPPLFPDSVKKGIRMVSTWVASLFSSIRSSVGTFRKLPDHDTKPIQQTNIAPFNGNGGPLPQTYPDSVELHLLPVSNPPQVHFGFNSQ